MTNRLSPLWSRLSPKQRITAIGATLLLSCCGGLAAIGTLAGAPKPSPGPGPAAERLADDAAAPPAAATGTTAPGPTPTRQNVTRRTVTERRPVPYQTRKVADPTLAEGRTRVRVAGARGVQTTTYEITLTDGTETARTLVRSVLTKRPVTRVVAVGTRTAPAGGRCNPNYSPCVPIASDVDCAGGSGDGPAYVQGPVRVIGTDPYRLDRDGDGIACDG